MTGVCYSNLPWMCALKLIELKIELDKALYLPTGQDTRNPTTDVFLEWKDVYYWN